MLNWLLEKLTKVPKPGETWVHRDYRKEGDPFPPKDPTAGAAVIRGYKDGWVRYKLGSGAIWDDERMQLYVFLFCYRR